MQRRNSIQHPVVQEIVFSEGGFTLLFAAPPLVISFLIASL